MKVAIVIEKYNPLRGGAERSTMEMADALTGQGCSVSIIAGKVSNAEETSGSIQIVDLEVTASRNTWFKLFDCAVTKYVNAHKFDIVHSITPITSMDVYQPRGGSQLNAMNQRIVRVSGLKRFYKKLTAGFNRARAMRLTAEKDMARGIDGPTITVLSNYVARQFTDGYGTPKDRIALIRNAVNVAKVESKENIAKKTADLRKELDIDDNAAIMLFVSADPVRKGLSELIEAFAAAKARTTDTQREMKLLVVGGFKFNHYYEQAKALGVQDDLIYYGKTREVAAFMHMADALVLPTWDDACSRVVMESLVAGTPAISTEFNGASELFADNKYGINIGSPENIAGLAEAMNKMADRKIQHKYADNIAASELKEQLSMDRHAKELCQLYKKIIQGK